MLNLIFKQFTIILPEISLVMLALFAQLSGLFFSKRVKIITDITVLISIMLLVFIAQCFTDIEMLGFNNSFALSRSIAIYKMVVLLFSIITIIIYKDYCQIIGEELKIEFIILVLLSTMGSFVAISSRNFLLLFCSMELQALIGYVLAGFSINNLKSSEGALKYFILGALISCLSLFGISYIYGFGGSLDYHHIFAKMQDPLPANIGLIVGLVLLLSSLFFKLAVVPFHVWAPDVYEGSCVPSVTYFSAASKIASVVVLFNIISLVKEYTPISTDLVTILAIFSMLFGSIGAIRQTSLKRLMGYSTILNIGYVLIGVALPGEDGNKAAIIYMIIYATAIVSFFACLIAVLGKKADTATFDDLKGIALKRKALAGGITVIMFSLIGIPPFAGFFGKYFIFYQAIIHQQFTLAIMGISTSVIAAYYYLKIVRSLYFLEAAEDYQLESLPTYPGLKIITCFLIAFLLFFSLIVWYPSTF